MEMEGLNSVINAFDQNDKVESDDQNDYHHNDNTAAEQDFGIVFGADRQNNNHQNDNPDNFGIENTTENTYCYSEPDLDTDDDEGDEEPLIQSTSSNPVLYRFLYIVLCTVPVMYIHPCDILTARIV